MAALDPLVSIPLLPHQQLLPNLVNLTRLELLLFPGVHVAIGTEPTATDQNFFVTTTDDEVLSLGIVESQRVVGMTTGATTFLDFPEGTGCPFGIGENSSLTVDGQSALDFEHKFIINVLTSSNVGGYYSTRVEIDHDTSRAQILSTLSPSATLRKSIKVTGQDHIRDWHCSHSTSSSFLRSKMKLIREEIESASILS